MKKIFALLVALAISILTVASAGATWADELVVGPVYGEQQVDIPPVVVQVPGQPLCYCFTVYRVKRGDNLFRIAVRNYGLKGAGHTWRVIKRANHIHGTTIYTGQRLIIPGL